MIKHLRAHVLYIAWIQALAATLISLYFSNIRNLPPCVLCWYQRIFMYPLVVILAVAILRRDRGAHWYVLPLSITGMGFAFYQYLLQAGIIPEALAPCTLGVSCATRYTVWGGFFTIPILSLIAFTLITLCMIIFMRDQKQPL